ncbi:MAG: hypothetical protein EOM68_16280 [Spirochaetia bacterium]|nr:hypothetical protein [Spirochaetia bacterium]
MFIIKALKGSDELLRRTTTDRAEASSHHAHMLKDIEGLSENLKSEYAIVRIDVITEQTLYDKTVTLHRDIVLIR